MQHGKPQRYAKYWPKTSEKSAKGHYIVLYCTVLYYTVLYCTVLYCALLLYSTLLYYILYYTILYYTILYYTILYYTILYYTILYYTILYYTILYYTILYYTILYYTIAYYAGPGASSGNTPMQRQLEELRTSDPQTIFRIGGTRKFTYRNSTALSLPQEEDVEGSCSNQTHGP